MIRRYPSSRRPNPAQANHVRRSGESCCAASQRLAARIRALRIEVDFRDMAQEIIVITNRVLPISTLPDALLLFEDLLCDRG
jgi:hypothetical protein